MRSRGLSVGSCLLAAALVATAAAQTNATQTAVPRLHLSAPPTATVPKGESAADQVADQAAEQGTVGHVEPPAPAAFAGPFPIGLSDYTGMLDGTRPVHLTLVGNADGSVTGSYFVLSDLKPLTFAGRVIDGTSLSAKVTIEGGDKTASPYLYLKVDKSGSDRLSGALYGDNEADKANQHSIAIALLSNNPAVSAEVDRYAVAGARDPTTVETTAGAFVQAVEAGQAQRAASLIAYPLVYTANGRRTLVHTSPEFVSRFATIFSPTYLAVLKTVQPKAMFATSQGIMLGDGQVWFNAEGKAFALNNQPVRMFARKRFLSNAGWTRAASQSQQAASQSGSRAK